MTDFIVDPLGNVTDTRLVTAENEAEAPRTLPKMARARVKAKATEAIRRKSMLRAAIIGVLVAFVIELVAGAWLYREHQSVTKAENNVELRELTVSSREEKATQGEKANKAEAEKLSLQEDRLEVMEVRLATENTRLTSKGKELSSKATALGEKERLLIQRKKEDEDDDENQAFALAFVQDTLDRIREGVKGQLALGWGPSTNVTPQALDTPGPEGGSPLGGQLKQLEARYQRIEQSEPEGESAVAGKAASLSELSSECAELISRGSIESLQIQAAIEVDLELLRDWAVKMEIPENVLPRNLYELLEISRLNELESLQVSKVAFLKERNSVFSGLYKGALAEAESTLQQIQDAKGKRPADPTHSFAKAILQRRISPANATALRAATSGEMRTAAINLRYAQLLNQQLAIRWWDIEVRQRFEDVVLLLSPEAREPFHTSKVRLTYIDLLSAATPSEPQSLRKSLKDMIKSPETVGEAFTQFISKRYSDPIRAAESYAILEAAYESKNGEVVTPDDRIAFKEWGAGHLSIGEVYELVTLRIDPLLGIFSDLAATNDPRAPHAGDRNDIEETRRALLTEESRRAEGISAREARLNSTTPIGPPEPQRLYGILRVMFDRAGTPEIKNAWLALAFDGLSAQLDQIDKAKREAKEVIRKNKEAIATLHEFREFEIPPGEIYNAELALAKSYKAIELRLNELRTESPANARVQSLLMRVKKGYGPNPPPLSDLESVKAASDYSDAFVISQIKTSLPKELMAINSSTETIVARTQTKKNVNSLSRRLAELSFRAYPDGLPHELVDGELPEHIKKKAREERIETWTRIFAETMGEKELQNSVASLESALTLAPRRLDLSKEFIYPVSILYDEAYGKDAFTRADPGNPADAQRLRAVMDRVTYMGRDRVGREVFRVDGDLRVVNKHSDGNITVCPLYVPK